MFLGSIFTLIYLLLAVVLFTAAIMTAWWLWKRATTPEGEAVPKWGNLRSLFEAARERGSSLVFRMALAAAIALVMTIPMRWIYNLNSERFERYESVVGEISSSWGSAQTLTGPVLYVPYTVKYQTIEEAPLSAAELTFEQSKGSGRTTREVVRNHEERYAAMVLPDILSADGTISTETRYRSIYSARVYTSDVKLSGLFPKPDLTKLRPNIAAVHWDKALFVAGITNTKAIRGISELRIAGGTHKFLPGTGGMNVFPTGFSVPCDLSGAGPLDFGFDLSVGGSGGFFMTPLGVSSSFTLASDWPHPNFTGSGLPTSRDIGADGFTARWEVPNLVRNYPQVGDALDWRPLLDEPVSVTPEEAAAAPSPSSTYRIDEYVVGVEFAEPVFHYSLLTRATKYGLLFIALTFLGLVIFENYYSRRGGDRLNAAQYAVIGAALALFYLTLLAASEHVGFTNAYLIASAQGVIMTGGYVAAAMRQPRPALMVAAVQSMLYAMLFFILRMEDYALLAGAILLVAATVVLMSATRGINRTE